MKGIEAKAPAPAQRSEPSRALDFWTPAPALAPYVSGYHFYSIDVGDAGTFSDIFFPAWANIRFTFPSGAWRIKLGNRSFDPVPAAALFGPTSHAGYAAGRSGSLVGAGLTPLGWTRLIGVDASHYADRVVPLEPVVGDEARMIGEALEAGETADALFDAWLLTRLAASEPEPPEVATLFALINDPAIDTVAELCERLDLPQRALVRLAKCHFGFGPKRLLRRARFMRALTRLTKEGKGRWAEEAEQAGYFDQSHFVRDCRLFLGRPLGEFVALPKPLMELSMRQRSRVLGAPAQALHLPPVPALHKSTTN